MQLILTEAIAVVVAMQNSTMNEDALMELITNTIYQYSIELTVACNLIALGIYFLIFYIAKKSLIKKIDISIPDKRAFLPTFLVGFTGQFVTTLILGLLMNVLQVFPQEWIDALNQNGDMIDNANPALSFFAVVILAPVFEEILCRGLILKTLNKTMNKWCAIVLSASIFGIIHGNPIQFIYATALGILLGWLYTKFDSILIPMLCHLAFNLVSQIAGYLDTENEAIAVLLALVMYVSIPIFIFSLVYFNITKFNKKADTVSVNQPEIQYQIPISIPTQEYSRSTLQALEDEIEGKNKNNKE